MTLLSFNSFIPLDSCISSCDDLATISTTCVFIRRENLLLFATLSRLNFIVLLSSRGVGVCKCSGMWKIRILGQSQWSLLIMGLSNSCLSISYILLLEVFLDNVTPHCLKNIYFRLWLNFLLKKSKQQQ